MAPEPTVIDGLLERHRRLHAYLMDAKETNLAFDADHNFKKLFVMACGSFFEERILTTLEAWAHAVGTPELGSLVRNKALKRQYHTFFDWEHRKLGPLLSLFGDRFKSVLKSELTNEVLARAQSDFLEIGALRNQLAHGNLAALQVEKTLDELVAQYHAAWKFVSFLLAKFRATPSPTY